MNLNGFDIEEAKILRLSGKPQNAPEGTIQGLCELTQLERSGQGSSCTEALCADTGCFSELVCMLKSPSLGLLRLRGCMTATVNLFTKAEITVRCSLVFQVANLPEVCKTFKLCSVVCSLTDTKHHGIQKTKCKSV